MPDDTPGINLQGYFQDKKGKNASPVSKLKDVVHMHDFGSPPVRMNAAQKKGSGKEPRAGKKSKGDEDARDGSDSE